MPLKKKEPDPDFAKLDMKALGGDHQESDFLRAVEEVYPPVNW